MQMLNMTQAVRQPIHRNLAFVFGAWIAAMMLLPTLPARANFGFALSFDGAQSYVGCPGVDLSGSNAMSLEVWILPGNITATDYSDLVRQQDPQLNPDFLLSFQNRGTILSYGLKCGGDYQELHVTIDPATYTDGNWHHLAATYDGTNQCIYRDGLLIGTAPRSGNLDFSGADNGIGATLVPAPGEFYNGLLDDVRIWRIARSASDIATRRLRPLTGNEPGLAAYYAFNEGAGILAMDSGAQGLGGLLYNNPVWVASTVPTQNEPVPTTAPATGVAPTSVRLNGSVIPRGVVATAFFEYGLTSNYGRQTPAQSYGSGQDPVAVQALITNLSASSAYHFRLVATGGGSTNFGADMMFFTGGPVRGYAVSLNGSNDFVRVPVLDFSAGATMTLEAWIRPADITTSAYGNILRQQSPGAPPDWLLSFQNFGTIVAFGLRNTALTYQELHVPISPKYFTDGHWHHLAATYDGGTMTLYVDAVPTGSTNQSGLVAFTGALNEIGERPGTIPQQELFNGAIDEVRYWRVARTPAQIVANACVTLAGNEPGLAAYYRFDDGAGTNTTDNSGRSLSGTLMNTAAWVPSIVPAYLSPLVTNQPVIGAGPNSATLNGLVYQRGSDLNAFFEFGSDTNYGSQTPSLDLGTSIGYTNLSVLITNLAPGQAYHYRLDAVDSNGPIFSADRIFFTPGNTAGSALRLEGTRSCVGTTPINLSNANALTLEAWINPSNLTTATFADVIMQGSASGADWLLGFQGNGTTLAFGVRAGGSYQELHIPVAPADFTNGSWHHLAATYDGLTKKVYVDGVLAGGDSQTGNVGLIGSVLTIGGPVVTGTSGYFNGQLDEVRIWRTALTQAQVLAQMNREMKGTDGGLALYYRFDEAVGNTTGDLTGNGRVGGFQNTPAWVASTAPVQSFSAVTTGYATNAAGGSATLSARVFPSGLAAASYFNYGTQATYSFQTATQNLLAAATPVVITSSVAGLLPGTRYHYQAVASNSTTIDYGRDRTFFTPGRTGGSALGFDGANSYVRFSAPVLSNGNAMSLEAWIKPAMLTNNPNAMVLRAASGATVDWLLGFENRGTVFAFGLRAGGTYAELQAPINPADLADGNWHHVAATYNGATKAIYLDGTLVGAASQSGNVSSTASSAACGASYNVISAADYFNGQIDEVRVWSVGRSAGDIAAGLNHSLTGLEPGLAASLRLDEGAGTTTADASGHGRTGTLINNPTWIASTSPLLPVAIAVSGLSSPAAYPGAAVVISGTNLAAVSAVLFNGFNAAFVTNSNASLTAIVPIGATTGPLLLTNLYSQIIATTSFVIDSTPPVVVVTSPTNATFVNGFSSLQAVASDENGGSGLLSVNFSLRREVDYSYWTGTTWGAPTLLGALSIGSSWMRTNGLPAKSDLTNGTYRVFANAIDNAGNSSIASVGVTLDLSAPNAPIRVETGGAVHVRFAVIPGHAYRIEASSDLKTWNVVLTAMGDFSGVLDYVDANATRPAFRFFRLVSP